LITAILTDFDVVSADSLKTARSLYESGDFSLIILDHHLPDGTGLEFCKEVHAIDTATPIVFITNDPEVTGSDVSLAGAQQLIGKDSLTFIDEILTTTENLAITLA